VLISQRSTKRSFILFLGALIGAAGWLGALSATPADAGPATHLVVVSAIADVRSGSVFQVIVEARDSNNVQDATFNGSVTLSAGAAGGSNFTANNVQNAVAGSATFTVFLNNAANGYVLTASSGGLTGGLSNSFNVTAHHLTITTAVANQRSGDPFTVSVEARDGNNAIAENYNALVSLTANVPIGGSAFATAQSRNTDNGIVTFNSLVLNNAANGYSLTAIGPGVTGGTSNSFNVTAHHLTITTALANVTAGSVFGLTVEARDGNNSVAENFNGSISLSAAAVGGSNFAIVPTGNAISGIRTFDGLVLNDPADGYVVTASSNSGLVPPNNGLSNSFNVTDAVNEPPVAVDDVLTLPRPPGGSATVDVLANDTDPDDDVLEVSAFDATGTNGGSIECTTDGDCTYTEVEGPCVTTDSFGYTVTDGEFTDVGRVDVTIDCDEPGVTTRTITLSLSRHLIAEGVLNGGTTRCTARNPVIIERLVDGQWVVMGTIKTKDDGSFKVRLPDRQGTYRARAPRKEFRVPPVICGRAVSARATHQH
jgi:hypothetical protein